MRVVHQSEAAECGLACVAMVCRHHGSPLSLPELRRAFPLSLKGVTLRDLMRIASRLGFRARPLRVGLAELARLRCPAILHWDLNHFVVLSGTRGRRVSILDPAAGRRRLDYAEVSPHFTGVALELTPTGAFRRRKSVDTVALRQLTGRLRGLGKAIGVVLLLSLALQVFVLLGPFFLQWVVDEVLVSADRDLLSVLASGFALLLLLQVGVAALRGWAVAFLSARLGLQWTGNVFTHLLRLPLDFFVKRHVGDVVSRIGSVRAIQRTLTTSFVEAIIDGLMAVATFLMMLLYSRTLAACALAAVLAYAGLRAASFRPLRDATERQLIAGARQQSYLLESIRGMQSIKIAGIEVGREATYANLMTDTVNQDFRLARLALTFDGANTVLFGTSRIAVIWVGALLTLENVFSAGMLIAYLAYQDQFAARIAGLINKGIEFRMLRLHGERLADVVMNPPEESVAAPSPSRKPADYGIEVRGLSFRYADGEPWVLKRVDFAVEDGEAVAIVGPSGCGKTTLMKLLLCLLRPTRGSIRIGGQDIAALGARHYRTMVGAVMQDDRLFAGTIADNIALCDARAEAARVQAAARLAGVHDEIADLPMGYDSLVGDMGTTLSGGQKQRVILARALYRRPRILFLDEATSHLDLRRERIVNEAICRLSLTRVIVAHRPETVASADRVLLLHGGRIGNLPRDRAPAGPAGRGRAGTAAA